MTDPDAVRREWARRVADEYDAWPDGSTPDAPRPDQPAGRTTSGWSWGVPADELEAVDLQLALRRRTGPTGRALREERAYWGLDRTGD